MAKEKEELKLKEIKVEDKPKKTRSKKEEGKTSTKTSTKKTQKTSKSSADKKDTTKSSKDKKDVKTETKKVAKKTTTSKSATTKKKTSSTKKTTETKKVSDKKKTSTKPKTNSSKNVNTKETKKSNTKTKTNSDAKTKTETKAKKDKAIIENEIVKEETIIEKIKSFIAKIVAMQEEARKEEESKKSKKKKDSIARSKNELGVLESSDYMPEYYDLPYRYNETVVKILAQTPKRIFVYWDIADEDRIRYEKAFGNDFFQKTYPVLLVHNDDKGYTTEIPINDFANSWYVDINDPKTKYTIQLGRKFKQIPNDIDRAKIEEQNIILNTDYLPIAQSNILEVPNNCILFNKLPRKIIYRNVKTYEEKEKLIEEIKTPMGILYNIKEFYENNYKNEIIDEKIIELNNPTSGGLSSSSFK